MISIYDIHNGELMPEKQRLLDEKWMIYESILKVFTSVNAAYLTFYGIILAESGKIFNNFWQNIY